MTSPLSQRVVLRRAALAVAFVVAVGVAPAAGASSASGPNSSPSKAGVVPVGDVGTVTLITGDTVQVSSAGNGRFSSSVQPAAGREQITFHTLEVDGSLRILPSDVVPYVSSGVLDADLFDVQELIADGYGDGRSQSLPLIVSYKNARSNEMRTLSGATTTRPLSSIGGAALSAEKTELAGFWKATAPAAALRTAAATSTPPQLGQGIKEIWLDGKVRPTLDRSTAQIGAPTVWKNGFTGTGVKVAVLDTGIDATHPDFEGRIQEAQSFTGDPDTTDRFGHGTHVASIIAGTGAASGGTRKGVAPGADLLIGKVLGDDGSGQESWIIGAMEWAAAQDASVINMSLGSGPTDGTDPMAEAVDRITAETGALFVIAAGNEGADQTVGSPGTAKSALTVGAVDRDETLADFSSRGPRLGDEGLKPEITAPGVGISAAHAAGTDIGPVDGQYMSLSGTSMATPHVAGVAALLAQVHPTWTAERLKNALVSTSRTAPDATVFGQGAGRVDAVRATTQSVQATGVADFGLLSSTDTTVAERNITYTNDGTSPITLAIELNLKNTSTGSTSSTGIDLASSVTVPAGKSVDVPVTVTVTMPARGQYSGWITATGPGGVLTTTALGVTVEGPRHTVTFKTLNRSGNPTNVPVIMLHGDSSRSDFMGYYMEGFPPPVAEVEEGSYLLDSLIEDSGLHEQATLITDPELKITKDTEILLDARKGTPIKIETPKPAEQQTVLSYYVHRKTGSGRQIDHGVMHFSNTETVNVTPTEPIKTGEYEFSSRWQLVAPLVRASVPGVSGAAVDLNLTRYAPAFTGKRTFPLVNAGQGSAAELEAAGVKGAAVLVKGPNEPAGESGPSERELTEAAAAAGASVIILLRPEGFSTWTSWTPDGEREGIPSVVTSAAEGQKLIDRAGKSKATIDLTMTPSSPYLYDVQQVSTGYVPSEIEYEVTKDNSARITTGYSDTGSNSPWVKEQRYGWRPWQDTAWNDTSRFVETGTEREEWISAGDSIWQQQVRPDWPWIDGGRVYGGMGELPRSYEPGKSETTWFSPVIRPASPTGVPELVSTRTGDTLNLRIPEFVDAAGHYTLGESMATGVELRRNDTVIAEPTEARQDVPTTPEAADYQLKLTTEREGEDWIWGTRTESIWDFRSAAASSGTAVTPLPLLQVDYEAPVDLTGKATTEKHRVALNLRRQDGLDEPQGTKVTVEVSLDEGRTWSSVKVTGSGIRFKAAVPAGEGTVSLRVKAVDGAGSAITQTVIRAYGRS